MQTTIAKRSISAEAASALAGAAFAHAGRAGLTIAVAVVNREGA